MVLELVAYSRARNASGVRHLAPMQLTVNSYRQAFDLVGDAVFLPAKDHGVLLALRDDRIEIYAGLSEYSGPRMVLPYADITGIERRRVRIYAAMFPASRSNARERCSSWVSCGRSCSVRWRSRKAWPSRDTARSSPRSMEAPRIDPGEAPSRCPERG